MAIKLRKASVISEVFSFLGVWFFFNQTKNREIRLFFCILNKGRPVLLTLLNCLLNFLNLDCPTLRFKDSPGVLIFSLSINLQILFYLFFIILEIVLKDFKYTNYFFVLQQRSQLSIVYTSPFNRHVLSIERDSLKFFGHKIQD